MGKHLLRPRVSETTCVICRDDHPTEGCPGCGALYHAECLGSLQRRCATLGCAAQPLARGVAVAPRSQAGGSGGLGCVLTAPVVLAIYVLVSFFPDEYMPHIVVLALTVPWLLLLGSVLDRLAASTPETASQSPSPVTPRPAPSPPAGSACLLCTRPALAGTSTCADHTALLGDRLGPARPAGARPGQLYGPGLIDGGGRTWRT